MQCWACGKGTYKMVKVSMSGPYTREVMRCDECSAERVHSFAKVDEVVVRSPKSEWMRWLYEGEALYASDVVVEGEETYAAGWTDAMRWLRRKAVDEEAKSWKN